MVDDTVIIEGPVKFRDGKKWKPRWCVMRKMSPVADCVQLQLYRVSPPRPGSATPGGDPRATPRPGHQATRPASCVASLSLSGWAGAEAGFTLSAHSLTLALLCRDHAAVLAFDQPEDLLTWQVKVNAHLGESLQFPVEAAEGRAVEGRGGAGRLHLLRGQLALTAGLPPRVTGMWDLKHIRRFGVVDGKFCFEAGAGAGRGAGVVALTTRRGDELAQELRRRAADMDGGECAEWGDAGADTWSLAETAGAGGVGGAGGAGGVGGAGRGAGSMPRCVSCMASLARAAREPGEPPAPCPAPAPAPIPGPGPARPRPGGAVFRPAWTMDALCRPTTLTRRPRDTQSCACDDDHTNSFKIGPYENYDVPKSFSTEINNEYYETPKRLREYADEDVFKMTRSATSASLVLKRSCQCLFQFGRKRKEPTVVEAEESLAPACACSRVTQWAHSWLRVRKDKENRPALQPPAAPGAPLAPGGPAPGAPGVEAGPAALYATVDVARKARRRAIANLTAGGPLHHYENLDFALSLEHYENAADVLRLSAGAGGCGCAGGPGGPYLAMSPGGGAYAAMCPRATSQPALGPAGAGGAGGAGAAGAAGGPRSASSADSGVSLSPPRRRARSAGPPAPPAAPPRPSSAASDLSDYIETLSICSSRSSTDTPDTCRSRRWAGEYQRAARLRPARTLRTPPD